MSSWGESWGWGTYAGFTYRSPKFRPQNTQFPEHHREQSQFQAGSRTQAPLGVAQVVHKQNYRTVTKINSRTGKSVHRAEHRLCMQETQIQPPTPSTDPPLLEATPEHRVQVTPSKDPEKKISHKWI